MAKRLTRAERARHEQQVKARTQTVVGTSPAKPSTRRTADVRATRVGVGSELAERAAWSLVAGLAALVGAGFALVISGSIVTALCPADDGTCSLGWMVVIGMVGYLLALLPACAIGGLGIWFWVAYLAGFAPLLVLASIGDWWWWTSLALLAPLAAIASAPFGRDRVASWQRWTLLSLAVIGVAVVVWWYGFAR